MDDDLELLDADAGYCMNDFEWLLMQDEAMFDVRAPRDRSRVNKKYYASYMFVIVLEDVNVTMRKDLWAAITEKQC